MRNTSLLLRATGLLAVAGLGATVWLGIWVTPPDEHMGNLVRLLYIHPPAAWVAFLAYGVAFLASLLYLWPRTRDLRLDRVAGASAEVGVVFTALTLLSGSIWGRPTWGTWWTWDPLLTTTALLFVLYLGYLALRSVPGDPVVRARRSAIGALIAFIDVPIVYFSVDWWRSLHQPPTVDLATRQMYVHGSMAWTMLLGFVAMTLLYCWLVGHRYRLATLVAIAESEGAEVALAERRAEARSDRLVGAGLGRLADVPSSPALEPAGAARAETMVETLGSEWRPEGGAGLAGSSAS